MAHVYYYDRNSSSTKFVFFQADQKTNITDLASDFRHFRLLLCNHRTELDEILQEASIHLPRTGFFMGQSENKEGFPYLWFAETFSTSILQLLNWI